MSMVEFSTSEMVVAAYVLLTFGTVFGFVLGGIFARRS